MNEASEAERMQCAVRTGGAKRRSRESYIIVNIIVCKQTLRQSDNRNKIYSFICAIVR